MKMACADCGETIYSDLDYVDVTITHYSDDRRINAKRTSLCVDCAPDLYRQLGLGT